MMSIKISTYALKIKSFNGQKKVFDIIREKYIVLTPEEFVRQNIIQYLIQDKNYSKNLMAVEYPLKISNSVFRCDLVLFNNKGIPRIIIECKAPSVKLTQKTIDQAANYNRKLKVDYLIISNGNHTYCCKMDYLYHSFEMVDIPDAGVINQFN